MSALDPGDFAYDDERQHASPNGPEPEADPLRALGDTLAFSADDWGASRAMAWVWGIVLGWDDDGPSDTDAMGELASRFGWSPEQVAHLRVLHERFAALAAGAEPEEKP